jgi:nicotinamidase-related amidase/isocitrate/isopropylmalate dehydrogenase
MGRGSKNSGRRPDLREFEVGLAVGEGTGPELAEVFERAVQSLGETFGVRVRLRRCRHRFRTFAPVAAGKWSTEQVIQVTREDARAYERFLRSLAARGCRTVFRTAFNAQSLYEVRERLGAVKVEQLKSATGEILLVRDQSQGFYGGKNSGPGNADEIRRTAVFSRQRTEAVIDFGLAEARARWDGPPDHVALAYKFHLLDDRFARWVDEAGRARGVDLRVYQPDTMNRHLLKGSFPGRLLLVGSNEWGDIMHADLLQRYGLGQQEERCSRNVYLAPPLAGLTEYQTVHGSADDLAGCGTVNPAATLRAVVAILEHEAGCSGAAAAMDEAIAATAIGGTTSPDLGGTSGTEQVLQAVLDAFRRPSGRAGGQCTALLVLDMQNDFLARDGHFARRGLVDPERTTPIAEPVLRLIAAARDCGILPVYLRMLADEATLPEVVLERNARTGRTGYLAPGSPGAGWFAVAPSPADLVITKQGYDPFLGTTLEETLRRHRVTRVVLVGAFTDLCVDSAARSAYQKGFRVTVVTDATLPLERDQHEALGFMARYYGADLADAATVLAGWDADRRAGG